MKIISWNVNGIRACAKKGFVSFVKKAKPDILCLQESKAHPDDVSLELKHPLKMSSYWSFADRKGYSGTVTFLPPSINTKVCYGIGH